MCLSVDQVREPCKNGRTDRDAVWGTDSRGPKKPCITRRWRSRSRTGRRILGVVQSTEKRWESLSGVYAATWITESLITALPFVLIAIAQLGSCCHCSILCYSAACRVHGGQRHFSRAASAASIHGTSHALIVNLDARPAGILTASRSSVSNRVIA